MAALQGQVTGVDISNKIYAEIMSISSSRPHSKRANSAKSLSTHISFPASPRNSARSKTSVRTNQGAYSDFDIIKSRSWSGSKIRSGTPVKTSAPGEGNPPLPHSALVSPGGSRLALPSSPHRSAAASPDPHRSVVTPTGSASRGLLTPRRGLTSGSSVGLSSSKISIPGRGSQVDRLHQEWAALENCRAMKRASEIVQHRLDPMYRLSGSTVPLLHRYRINDEELQRLQEMAETSRILQHDLKRIKFPHAGPRTPRKERNKSKGRNPQQDEMQAANADNAVDNNANSEEAEKQPDDTGTPQEQHLAPNAVHPSSPISTPDFTPRQAEGGASQGSGQQGELIQQGETSGGDEGEVNVADDDDETQERSEVDDD